MTYTSFWGVKVDREHDWFIDNADIEEHGVMDVHINDTAFLVLVESFEFVEDKAVIKAPIWLEDYWLKLHTSATRLQIEHNIEDFGWWVTAGEEWELTYGNES